MHVSLTCANITLSEPDAVAVVQYSKTASSSIATKAKASSFSSKSFRGTHVTSATTHSKGSGAKATTSTNQSPNPSKGNAKHAGLSTGASIGIGVAITIVGIGIIAAIAFIIFWRRRSRRRMSNREDEQDMAQRFGDVQPVHAIHEKDSKNVKGELATTANTHEMPERGKSQRDPPTEMAAG